MQQATEQADGQATGQQRIPIFPLNVVVFPGMALPLHIFEPRYQLMTRHCLEGDRTFGVCLISTGQEVGTPADPHLVGTTCEIVASVPLGDGRWNLNTVGRRRFRIRKLLLDQPFAEAEVEFLPDEAADAPGPLSAQVKKGVEDYIIAILSANGLEYQELDLPEEPLQLSYLVGAVLQGDPAERQALLEMQSVQERLERELELLKAGTERARKVGQEQTQAHRLRVDPSQVCLN